MGDTVQHILENKEKNNGKAKGRIWHNSRRKLYNTKRPDETKEYSVKYFEELLQTMGGKTRL